MIKRPRIVTLELEGIPDRSDKSVTEKYIDKLENAVSRAHESLSRGASAAEVMGILEEGCDTCTHASIVVLLPFDKQEK